jgi:hypothetical protein
MKKIRILSFVASSVLVFASAQAHAATYCGWIDDAKFGATLTDKTGTHSLSEVRDQASADLVYKIQTSMKSWPSCGCITGKIGKTEDFDFVTGFTFKPIKACQADKSLEQR